MAARISNIRQFVASSAVTRQEQSFRFGLLASLVELPEADSDSDEAPTKQDQKENDQTATRATRDSLGGGPPQEREEVCLAYQLWQRGHRHRLLRWRGEEPGGNPGRTWARGFVWCSWPQAWLFALRWHGLESDSLPHAGHSQLFWWIPGFSERATHEKCDVRMLDRHQMTRTIQAVIFASQAPEPAKSVSKPRRAMSKS